MFRGPNFHVDKYGISRDNINLAMFLHHLINKDLTFSKELFRLWLQKKSETGFYFAFFQVLRIAAQQLESFDGFGCELH